MSYSGEFLIENGILKEYYGPGGVIEIPEGVVDIAPFAFCYCEMDELILPKSLRRLKKDAFRRGKSLGTIRILGSEMKFGKKVFAYVPAFPFVVAPKLPLGTIPPEIKPNACCGFAREEDAFGKTAQEQYLKYIQRQRKSLYPAALLCDELLRLMLKGKFVSRDEAEELAASLSQNGKTELSAEVMRYQNTNFKPKDPLRELLREANRDPYSVTEMKKLWEIEKKADGTVKIRAYKGNEERIAVPPRVGKAVVTELGDFCFQFSNRPRPERGVRLLPFKQIFLPDTIEKIGKRAFEGCTELEKLHLPESLKEVSTGFSEDAHALSEIRFPQGLTKIGSRAFLRCDGLSALVIPENVRVVGSYAFSACKNLRKVVFSGGTEEIQTEAFSDCVVLETIILQEGTKRLGYGAFGDCEALRNIFLPGSLMEIGRNAFYGCRNLVIHAPQNSFAEIYAGEHQIPFRKSDTEDEI